MASDECKQAALSRDELLAIFDSDAHAAEEKYANLYQKLVRYFEWNRTPEPEDTAQEALKRGFARLREGQKITAGDPAAYFFGIARNLVREGWHIRKTEQRSEPFEDQPVLIVQSSFHNLTPGEQAVLLAECLRELADDEFEMLLAYVEGEGETWARKAGVELGALRLRIHRLRKRLEKVANLNTNTSVRKKP